jgi:hypothetical protein
LPHLRGDISVVLTLLAKFVAKRFFSAVLLTKVSPCATLPNANGEPSFAKNDKSICLEFKLKCTVFILLTKQLLTT